MGARAVVGIGSVAATLLLLTLGAPSGPAELIPPELEHAQKAFLEASSATADPFLAFEEGASATTAFTSVALASGVVPSTAAMTDTKPTPTAFSAKVPLATTQWLNLSHKVNVKVFWQSTLASSGGADGGRFRVEVKTGERFVGGIDASFGAATMGPWITISGAFYPEVSSFKAGEKLSVLVYRYTSSADFAVGTGGNAQSHIEYFWVAQDPLAGGLYLEQGQLVNSGDEGEDADADGSTLPVYGFAGLLAVPTLRRRAPVLAIALLVALGGCLGGTAKGGPGEEGGSAEDGGPQSTAESHVEHNDTLASKGIGSIQGRVRNGDSALIPIPNAHASLLGTNVFMDTDASGAFLFENVSANTYILRVDAKGFAAYEGSVKVEVGSRVTLNVTLYKPVLGNAPADTTKAHRHDLWGGDTTKDLFTASVMPRTQYDTTGVGRSIATSNNGWTQTTSSAYWDEAFHPRHSAVVPDKLVVLPGTVEIEVTATWTPDTVFPVKEVGLSLVPASGPLHPVYGWPTVRDYLPRGTGVAFHVPIFPNQADSGHQKFTRWDFAVVLPTPGGAGTPVTPLAYATGPITLNVKIHKGVVPFEPAHEDFWNGATELELFPKIYGRGSSSLNPSPGYPATIGTRFPAPNFLPPPATGFVPPGAVEIRGNFSWRNTGNPPASPISYVLAYMGTDTNPQGGNWKYATMTPTGPTSATFVIPVDSNETDQFYQRRTYWQFSPDTHDDDSLAPHQVNTNIGQPILFRLDAIVYKSAQ